MQKTKIDMSKYADMHEEKVLTGKDGQTVTVRNHISCADKEAMAQEIAENVLAIHDDSCVYESYRYEVVEKYFIAKYYTDIDTDGVTEEEVADFLVNNELLGAIVAIIGVDFGVVLEIYELIKDAYIETYGDDKSLTKAIRTSFGFLFNGEDITSSMAKAESTSGMLFDAISALRSEEKKKVETVDNGMLKIGGNVINFAKKG